MGKASVNEVTRLLEAMRGGDVGAANQLLPLVYDHLRGLAGAVFGGRAAHHTLQPTALVHEAWLKMAPGVGRLQDRTHFFAVAARAMRQVLADHARGALREKRGGGRPHVTLIDGAMMEAATFDVDLTALHDALEELARLNERHARIVELRVLGGLTVVETANLLDVSPATVKSDWSMARAWLLSALQ